MKSFEVAMSQIKTEVMASAYATGGMKDRPPPLNLQSQDMNYAVQVFLSRFDDYINGLHAKPEDTSETQKIALFKRSIGDQALLRFENAIDLRAITVFDDLVEQFREVFAVKLPLTLAIVEFVNCKQVADESVEDFAHRLRVLASSCKVTETVGLRERQMNASTDQYILALFVAGLDDGDAREYLLEKAPKTIRRIG